MSVDLPAPFSPHSPWISPRLTWMDTSLSAVTPGNCFVTREISRRASSGTSTSSERPGLSGRARHVHGYALLLGRRIRSEEHTSELQSRPHLVCRLLLEKKKKNRDPATDLLALA